MTRWIGKQNAAYAKSNRESEVMPNAVSANPNDRMNGKEVMPNNGPVPPDNAQPRSYETGALIPGTLLTQADLDVDL